MLLNNWINANKIGMNEYCGVVDRGEADWTDAYIIRKEQTIHKRYALAKFGLGLVDKNELQ